MAIAKAAVAAVGVVGLATATTIAMVSSGEMPAWVALEKDSDFATAYSNGSPDKYGKTYGRFLVGKGVEENKKNPNDAWWQWVFANRYNKEDKTDAFKELGTWEKLRDACKASYAGTLSAAADSNPAKITVSGTDTSQTEYKEENLWKYCSPAEEKIKSITDEGRAETEYKVTTDALYGTTGDTVKKDLVSVLSKSKGNAWFWAQKEKEISPEKRSKLITGKIKSVKGWRSEAYKNTATTETAPYTTAEVLALCSISGKSA